MEKSTVLINGTVLTGYSKMKNCCVLIKGNKISDIFNMSRLENKKFDAKTKIIDVEGSYIAPGLIDTHIHGSGGHGTEDCDYKGILEMSKTLAEFGVTSFFPTIYTDYEDRMIAAIKAIVKAKGREEGAKIRGIHLEGPFISKDKAGAQTYDAISEVDIDKFNRLIDAGEGLVRCMTLAPELKNMRELALHATNRNIVLLAGHTNAKYENILEGMQAGILHSTHLFNAMSKLHHRNPGTVGAVLIQEDMRTEIIPDGVHVHPELIKLLIRNKPLSNIVLITDALRPTEQNTGTLMANNEEAVLGQDGAFHKKSDSSLLIGSALTLIKGVKNLVSWEIPVEDAVQMATKNPAKVYDMDSRGVLLPNKKADVIVFNKDFDVEYVFIGGEKKKEKK